MVKRFLSAHKGLHIWLGSTVLFLCLFWLTRGNRVWMNALTEYVTGPLKRAFGAVCYLVPFSVMELLVAALVLGCAAGLVVCVVGTIRSRRKGSFLYGSFLVLLCTGLSVYAGFCLLWGVNYYTDSFQERSGLYAQDVSVEDLAATMDFFVDRLSETANTVPRDANGLFSTSREEILKNGVRAYSALSQEYPFLAFDDKPPKGVFFSRIMSRMNFTGVYCPFTGESNVNIDSPACMLPATVAHELAHQRGVASEQECNFLAILASTTCGDPVYAYSGWLLGYVHLSNALYRADQSLWEAAWARMPETVKTDIRDNNAYWKQFEGVAADASQTVYDQFLKSYGESRGIQSYGTVVDLLVVYYKDFSLQPQL